MSHELRTPLLTIVYFLELIMKVLITRPLPIESIPVTLKYANLMMNQLKFMESFVDDLLDLQ